MPRTRLGSIRQADGLEPVRALQRVLYRSAKQDPIRRVASTALLRQAQPAATRCGERCVHSSPRSQGCGVAIGELSRRSWVKENGRPHFSGVTNLETESRSHPTSEKLHNFDEKVYLHMH